MLRLVLLGSRRHARRRRRVPVLAGGEPGPDRRSAPLPPEIAYRDPAYLAAAAPGRSSRRRWSVAPRALALPLYNEPPPRFPVP